jgi:hypothetical protein
MAGTLYGAACQTDKRPPEALACPGRPDPRQRIPQCPRLPTDRPHPSAAQEIRQALEAQDRAEAPADLLSELTAMADCAIVLARLDADPQARVLRWLVARFGDDAPLRGLR